MALLMLSTVDNPFDPFTQFDEWFAWDAKAGYHTLDLLGRLIRTSDDLSEAEQQDIYNSVVQEIVDENVLGLYIAVEEGTPPRPRQSA